MTAKQDQLNGRIATIIKEVGTYGRFRKIPPSIKLKAIATASKFGRRPQCPVFLTTSPPAPS